MISCCCGTRTTNKVMITAFLPGKWQSSYNAASSVTYHHLFFLSLQSTHLITDYDSIHSSDCLATAALVPQRNKKFKKKKTKFFE